jgi:capsular exopolysaccharide synthesis family protein
MSRFYDALRQANRFPGTPEEESSAPIPSGIAEMMAGLSKPETAAAPSSEEFPADEHEQAGAPSPVPLPAPRNGTGEEAVRETYSAPAAAIPRNGSFGTPILTSADHKARLISHATDSMVSEHYRLLRTQILQQQANRMFRTVLITSPNPGEGKTVTLLNLGLIFAMLPSSRVLVVDGDLRKGNVGRWLGVRDDQPGLSNLIEGSIRLEEAVLQSPSVPVRFMVRGNSGLPPAELLHSSKLKGIFQELAARFDLVLVDSPPANLLTDAQLLASACDAVLLVARAFSTSQKGLEEAAEQLRPFYLIGCILNGSPSTRRSYQYGYYK